MKKVFLSILIAAALLSSMHILLSWQNDQQRQREFYQLTIYHFNTVSQEKILDNYFQNALLPALHRAGIKNVGVLKSWANDTLADKLIYVLVPSPSLDALVKTRDQLKKDLDHNTSVTEYLNADPKNPAYTRIETILLRAFPLAPKMQLPSLQSPKKNRVYELRSYESAT